MQFCDTNQTEKALILSNKELEEMSRIRLVSRNIKTYVYRVMGYDRNTKELVTKDITITGDKPSEKDLLKELTSDDFQALEANYQTFSECLYVMSEKDFMRYARKSTDGKRVLSDENSEDNSDDNSDNNSD